MPFFLANLPKQKSAISVADLAPLKSLAFIVAGSLYVSLSGVANPYGIMNPPLSGVMI
ncbi:hypothetical protein WAI453_013699 [Rhynchosporium graminicola]